MVCTQGVCAPSSYPRGSLEPVTFFSVETVLNPAKSGGALCPRMGAIGLELSPRLCCFLSWQIKVIRARKTVQARALA